MMLAPFIAAELLADIDLPATQKRLASIVNSSVLPRLVRMHREPFPAVAKTPKSLAIHDIERLAHLVLDPSIHLSSDFIIALEAQGHSIENLFVDLLEPAARCLGTKWDNDECSFIDVTLGMARLQQLLAMFSRSHAVSDFSQKRKVCMITLADEQHSFGATMVENFLQAGGWAVRSRHRATASQIAEMVAGEWFAVVGLTISSTTQCDQLASTIGTIRTRSCNPAIGVMVGGPPFAGHAEMVAEVGADATAINAPAAVLVTQRLFDLGAARNWQG
jgi:methanogenic corrinoid protein MtbC1